jgi:P27 family predicted phage terminase small subunit
MVSVNLAFRPTSPADIIITLKRGLIMSRIPKPTSYKILSGEPNKSRINFNEPQPTGKTTPPKFLNHWAKNEWKRIVPELERLGLFTKVDRASLAAYCQVYGRWVETENKINELTTKAIESGGDASNAYLLKTQAGNVIISPLLSVANRCLEQMKTFLVEFGMTPVSRSRINLAQKDKDIDPLEELLNEPQDFPERER